MARTVDGRGATEANDREVRLVLRFQLQTPGRQREVLNGRVAPPGPVLGGRRREVLDGSRSAVGSRVRLSGSWS